MKRSRIECSSFLPRSISVLFLISLIAGYSTNARGQTLETEGRTPSAQPTRVEIPILQQVDSRRAGFGHCGYPSKTAGPVVEEEEFRKLIVPKATGMEPSLSDRCVFLKRLEVDFDRQTLLRYGVNGDCFVRATARVFREDSTKTYVLRITKIYGGCRAGGSFEGWLVIDKLNPEYRIEVELFERNESDVTRRVGKR